MEKGQGICNHLLLHSPTSLNYTKINVFKYIFLQVQSTILILKFVSSLNLKLRHLETSIIKNIRAVLNKMSFVFFGYKKLKFQNMKTHYLVLLARYLHSIKIGPLVCSPAIFMDPHNNNIFICKNI